MLDSNAKENLMKLWKFNKRSSTLADMSMNRVLLTELIAKGGPCWGDCRFLWGIIPLFDT